MYNNKRLYIQRNFLTFSQISSLFVENFKNLNIFINIFFCRKFKCFRMVIVSLKDILVHTRKHF